MLKENEAILKTRSDVVKKEEGTIESCYRVGPHNYSNHFVAGRFFFESLPPCSGLLDMHSTPRMDAR